MSRMNAILKRTPLYVFHLDHGARMVPFAGWEMPLQYTSILEEHRAVRTAAGLFDVSHMGEVRVHGGEARAFLDRLVTGEVERLRTGRALYALMCYEDGGVVDDLIIYQVGDAEYLLCVNAANTEKDLEWINGQAVGFDCLVDDVSDAFAQLALQGPRALDIFQAASGKPLAGLGRFHFVEDTFFETRALVSRTGYTGEDGVEIYLSPDEAVRVANRIHEAGKEHGLVLAGLGARDSLRLEAGYPLYGHEISGQIDPLTAGLGWAVKLGKRADFIGKEALAARQRSGLPQKVVFFRIRDRRIARQGTTVLDATGRPCGTVLSGAYSPLTGTAIGSALVEVAALAAGPPTVEIRGTRLALEIATPPLHASGVA